MVHHLHEMGNVFISTQRGQRDELQLVVKDMVSDKLSSRGGVLPVLKFFRRVLHLMYYFSEPKLISNKF